MNGATTGGLAIWQRIRPFRTIMSKVGEMPVAHAVPMQAMPVAQAVPVGQLMQPMNVSVGHSGGKNKCLHIALMVCPPMRYLCLSSGTGRGILVLFCASDTDRSTLSYRHSASSISCLAFSPSFRATLPGFLEVFLSVFWGRLPALCTIPADAAAGRLHPAH